jgi:hypothetical protein
MADEPGLMEWAFKGMVTGGFSLGLYLWSGLVKDVRQNKDRISSNELYLAQNYPTKEDIAIFRIENTESVNKLTQTVNESVRRIHDRLDQSGKEREANFKDTAHAIGELKDDTTQALSELKDLIINRK